MMDLNLVRVFTAVMEEGSVTAAAYRLNLSQPSVTQGLNRLRRIAGCDLFRKEGRGIVPTRAGLQLFEEIGRLPHLVDDAMGRLSKFDPLRAETTFRIALTDLGQAVFLPTLVSGLAAEAPGCSLNVVDLDTESAGEELTSGRLDLAVSSTLLDGNLQATIVRWDRYCCVARKGTFPEPAPSLEDLTGLPRIVVRGSAGHSYMQSLLPPAPAGSVHLSGFAAIPGVLAVRDLVTFVPEVVTSEWISRWGFDVLPLLGDEFAAPVRAHTASQAASSASAWFAEWAIATLRTPTTDSSNT
ncbi:LysR family transcriptional regulator [Arthrobacter sp. D5-1]|uniref:LysR family transcriptional regulator n=1 Tax=Arthrobacter sp. D5-1 TaxID=1477518 RepID=UPI001A99EF78|nr:LysR family transcriptional regulator [Arthrobacter sp. D5-1]QSZ47663.1 hypothetical protein AYX22_04005 [Arthrobacter sp. D5-1]